MNSKRSRLPVPELIDYVSNNLFYDKREGKIYWSFKSKISVTKGREAGHISSNGYRRMIIKGVQYPIHRIVWIIESQSYPAGVIDHLNGNKLDNRISNLRDCSFQMNVQNTTRPSKNNASGYAGVYKRSNGRYSAKLSIDRKSINCGTFDTAKDAHAAYIDAKTRFHLGYIAASGGQL